MIGGIFRYVYVRGLPHLYKSTLLLHKKPPFVFATIAGPHQEVATCGRHIVLVTRLFLSLSLSFSSFLLPPSSFSLHSRHENYGLGYRWSPDSLTIHVGDTVEWAWTRSSFTTRTNVAQVHQTADRLRC